MAKASHLPAIATQTATAQPAALPAGQSAPATPAQATDELTAAAWQAVGRLADKLSARDALADGTAYAVAVQIQASIDGHVIVDTVGQVNLTVGHATTKASSAGPDQAHLLAVLLGKLNTVTREKIFRELPAEFAANGCELPAASDSLTEAASELLKRLRQEKRVAQRGPVKAAFQLAQIDRGERG